MCKHSHGDILLLDWNCMLAPSCHREYVMGFWVPAHVHFPDPLMSKPPNQMNSLLQVTTKEWMKSLAILALKLQQVITFVLAHRLKRVRFGVCHGNRNVKTFKLKPVTIVEKSVLKDVVVFHFAFYGDEMSLVMRLLTILLCVYPVECVVGKFITRTHVFRESRWAT